MKMRSLFIFSWITVLHLLNGCSSDPDSGQNPDNAHFPGEQQTVPIESFDDLQENGEENDSLRTNKAPSLNPSDYYDPFSEYKKTPLSSISYLYRHNKETLEEILKIKMEYPFFKYLSTTYYPSLAPEMTVFLSSLWAFPCSMKNKNNPYLPWSRVGEGESGGGKTRHAFIDEISLDVERILNRLNSLNGKDDHSGHISHPYGHELIPSTQAHGIEGGDVNSPKLMADRMEEAPYDEEDLMEKANSFHSKESWKALLSKYLEKDWSNSSGTQILNIVKQIDPILPSPLRESWLLGRPVKVYFSDDTHYEITIYIPDNMDLQIYFDDDFSLEIEKIKLRTGIGIDIREFAQHRKEITMMDNREKETKEIMPHMEEVLGLSIKVDDIESITLPNTSLLPESINQLCTHH